MSTPSVRHASAGKQQRKKMLRTARSVAAKIVHMTLSTRRCAQQQRHLNSVLVEQGMGLLYDRSIQDLVALSHKGVKFLLGDDQHAALTPCGCGKGFIIEAQALA